VHTNYQNIKNYLSLLHSIYQILTKIAKSHMKLQIESYYRNCQN